MDTLTFVSNMTSALSWPVVIATSLWYFRKEIKSFFSGMKRLKLGPMEAEMFELKTMEVRQLADVVANITTPPPLIYNRPPTPVSDQSKTESLGPMVSRSVKSDDRLREERENLILEILTSDRSARQKILQSWDILEDGLRSFSERIGFNSPSSVMTILLELKNRGDLNTHQFKIIRNLHELRNTLVNSTLVATDESATNFGFAVSDVLDTIGDSDKRGRSAKLREVSLATSTES